MAISFSISGRCNETNFRRESRQKTEELISVEEEEDWWARGGVSFSLLKNCRPEEEKKEIDDLIVFVCRGLADLPSRTKLPQ